MSKRNKLLKFAELSKIPFVFQCFDYEQTKLIDHNEQAIDYRGKWSQQVFGNDKPVVLELACGRGEYTIAMAKESPDKNFIGVDVKGARIWQGAKFAIEFGLKNVAFVRTRIEMLDRFFGSEEISEIWITFPDPFLKDSKANRRLTAPTFLNIYRKILKNDGICHLKTDNQPLFDFSLESLESEKVSIKYVNDDIYSGPFKVPELVHKTYYENKHLEKGLTIKYIQFQLS